jgi:heme/copper-type cytochrome/quinol oxidase subunit 1
VPPLIRRYVKTSFVFLLAGLGLGGHVLVARQRGALPSPLLITAHVHLLLVGFVLMIVMGVATWMFPRPARGDARYHPELGGVIYWLVTVCTALRAAAEVAGGYLDLPPLALLRILGALGQIAAALVFVVNMWSRVRMPGTAV